MTAEFESNDKTREEEDIVNSLNVDNLSSGKDFSYPKTSDPVLRTSLRTGEFIHAAAVTKGVDLHVDEPVEGDEWLSLMPERLMPALRTYGEQIARVVLKEARKNVNRSSLNGDKESVLGNLRDLLASLGRPKEPKESLTLPAIPGKTVEISISK